MQAPENRTRLVPRRIERCLRVHWLAGRPRGEKPVLKSDRIADRRHEELPKLVMRESNPNAERVRIVGSEGLDHDLSDSNDHGIIAANQNSGLSDGAQSRRH